MKLQRYQTRIDDIDVCVHVFVDICIDVDVDVCVNVFVLGWHGAL